MEPGSPLEGAPLVVKPPMGVAGCGVARLDTGADLLLYAQVGWAGGRV